MKLVRPLGVERVNDESEPYPSKGLRIPVDEIPSECGCLELQHGKRIDFSCLLVLVYSRCGF